MSEVQLKKMSSENIDKWIEEMTRKLGHDMEKAFSLKSGTGASVAKRDVEGLFPEGKQEHPDSFFYDIISTKEGLVGKLWLVLRRGTGTLYAHIGNIEIDPAFRSKGFGRAALEKAQAVAKASGACFMLLNVFDSNSVAKKLYESLGYQPVSISMKLAL